MSPGVLGLVLANCNLNYRLVWQLLHLQLFTFTIYYSIQIEYLLTTISLGLQSFFQHLFVLK